MNMLATRTVVRHFSTQSIVEKWFNALQSPTHDEQQTKLAACIEYILQQNQINYPKLIQDIIHRWAVEQPSKEALWVHENDNNKNQKLTFQEIYAQSTNLTHILSGYQFNLTSEKNVMVVLPPTVKERLLLQFACLQSNLNFSSLDSKNLHSQAICEQIRTSAIDCIITNEKHLEMVMKCTYTVLRPLKKGLIIEQSKSQPLPVGWYPITPNEKKESPVTFNQTSHSTSFLRSLFIAYWLNMKKSPRFIWIKDNHDQISFAPWLLGSTIFYKETSDPHAITQTLGNYPIDTLCASETDRPILDKQTPCNILYTDTMIDSRILDLNSAATLLSDKTLD